MNDIWSTFCVMVWIIASTREGGDKKLYFSNAGTARVHNDQSNGELRGRKWGRGGAEGGISG